MKKKVLGILVPLGIAIVCSLGAWAASQQSSTFGSYKSTTLDRRMPCESCAKDETAQGDKPAGGVSDNKPCCRKGNVDQQAAKKPCCDKGIVEPQVVKRPCCDKGTVNPQAAKRPCCDKGNNDAQGAKKPPCKHNPDGQAGSKPCCNKEATRTPSSPRPSP